MTMIYSNPAREQEAGALPDVEVFYHDCTASTAPCPMAVHTNDDGELCPCAEFECERGWYWRANLDALTALGREAAERNEPGGPFDTEAEAIADAPTTIGTPNAGPFGLPPCVLAMRCYCAGHARGNPASEPCDTNEEA